MFINNWYAACVAADLGDAPLRVRMLDAAFVLFRDSGGTIRCLSDSCCHRGASLAAGHCAHGQIHCPQHGWVFNGDGRCTLIPAGTKNPARPPKRARVPAYPVQEQYGLVFVFLGDLAEAERPTLPDLLPEYDSGDWHCGIIRRRKNIHWLRMHENYNDPTHVHYVHEFAQWLPKGVTIVDHALTDTTVKAFHASHDADGHWNEHTGLMMEYSVIGSLSRNTNRQPDYPPQIVLASVTPVDEYNSQIFMHLLQPKHGPESLSQHALLMGMTEHQVMDEDYTVLVTTRPRLAASPAEELLVKTDATVAQVRRITTDYARRAGEIDTQALDRLRDTHIRVIPCPAHRTDPTGWVHKTVPLRDRPDACSPRPAAS